MQICCFRAVIIGVIMTLIMLSTISAADPMPATVQQQLELTKPGPEHQKLARHVGKWNVAVRMGSGANAVSYTGTGEGRMVVGGRFLQLEYQAKQETDTTEGLMLLGFDRRHKRFTMSAHDSFGTYVVSSRGTMDESSGKIRMHGTDDDPVMKALGHEKAFVHVLDPRSDDEFAIEIWFVDTRTAARKEFKYMEYVFTRRGKP